MTTQHWLISGASGQLGGHLLTQLARRGGGERITALAGRTDPPGGATCVLRVSLEQPEKLRTLLLELRPTHVIHTAALTSVADAFADPPRAELCNAVATEVLAQAAASLGARFVFTSTDMVFAGDAAPYRELDTARPLSIYGRSKLDAERRIAPLPNTLAVRVPLLFGVPTNGRETTFVKQMAALRCGQPVSLFTDEHRTPIELADAARALLGLAESARCGVIHIAGAERLSRFELIERVAGREGLDRRLLKPVSRLDFSAPEPRPADLSLDAACFAREFPQLQPRPLV